MEWKLKLTAFLTVILMLTVAAVPVVDASVEEAVEEEPMMVADEEYGFGIGTLIVVGLICAVAGGYLGYKMADPAENKDAGADQEKIYQAQRKAYGDNIAYASDVATNMITTILPQDADLWFFTTDAWQKTIEYVVAENWSLDSDGFEACMDELMVQSGLPVNAANYVANWGLAIDNTYNGLSTYSQVLGTREYGATMVYKMMLGSKIIKQPAAPSTSDLILMDMTQFVKPSSSANRVYLDTELTSKTQGLDYCKSIYVFGQSDATITDSDGNKTILSPGVNDLVAKGLTSGVYTLNTQCTYAGPFIPLGNSHAADVRGGMVVKQGNILNYLLPTDSGTIDVYNSTGTSSSTCTTVSLAVDYIGPDGSTTATSVLVGTNSAGTPVNILRDYDNLIQQISLVTSNTNEAAKALWEIYDACEAKNQYIKPSSLTINVPGHKLTAAEYKAVYIQAMRQLADYANENETELMEITTNAESIGLYCYGDIYYQGKLWAENVVFTPYISTKGITLNIGQNKWDGSGFAMLWAQTPDFSSWDGVASIGNCQLLDLSEGYTLVIENIISEGNDVDTIDLTKTTIQKMDIGPVNPPDPVDDDDIQVVNADILVLLIILELGIIIALLGVYTGNSGLVIIGVIVAIVGILWPNLILHLAMGTASWDDLMPLQWL